VIAALCPAEKKRKSRRQALKSVHHRRSRRPRTGQLIGAAFVAANLVAAGAAIADEPAHLEAQAAMTVSEAKARCAPALVRPGQACEVGEFGRVGTVAGHGFSYARYDFKPAPDDPYYPLAFPRVVIFERLTSGMLLPILISGDDAAFWYDKPKILRSAGRVLLHIPATESGTGNFNREILYVWVKDGWRDVDVTSWLDDLKRRLPQGLGVLQGIYPDYATMKAETPLWRDNDGGNCPNGGRASIDLQWHGDLIAVRSFRIEKAGECGEPLPPRQGGN
jgi:hypothetical protein